MQDYIIIAGSTLVIFMLSYFQIKFMKNIDHDYILENRVLC